MQLQTHVTLSESTFKINYNNKGVILGSCFADNIGARMYKLYFDIQNNPYGTLYNPISILNTLKYIHSNHQFAKSDLVYTNGLWHSMMHHGSFSSPDYNVVLKKINSYQPNNFQYIIITLGSTWTYRYQGNTVANCHKIPSNNFTRYNLSYSEVLDSLYQIRNLYHNIPMIFTVSPIRHLKDGLMANSLSKATLRAAIGEIVTTTDNSCYFPAFEIMNDELRDYRFYTEDMLHPTEQSVNYIWSRFKTGFIDETSNLYIKELTKFFNLINHRPLHPESDSYVILQNKIMQIEQELTLKYPHLTNKISTFEHSI